MDVMKKCELYEKQKKERRARINKELEQKRKKVEISKLIFALEKVKLKKRI